MRLLDNSQAQIRLESPAVRLEALSQRAVPHETYALILPGTDGMAHKGFDQLTQRQATRQGISDLRSMLIQRVFLRV